VELGALHERDMVAALAKHLRVPLVDLRKESPQGQAVGLLPEERARALKAVALRRDEKEAIVAVADPKNPEICAELQSLVGVSLKLVLAPASDIERAINNSYRALDNVGRLVEAFQVAESARKTTAGTATAIADDAPVVRVVNLLITQAVRDRTSDIHVEPQDSRVRIRYRIDGALHDVASLPETMGPAIISRLKIMANLNIVERRRAQDGTIATEVEGRTLDIRVNTTPTIWGEKAVLRILDRKRTLLTLDDLGMPARVHDVYSRLVRAPYGMLICAGPTGCGKTTTLYATLNEVNDTKSNITTVEDPVEFVFPSINQIQINEQAGITFAGGLRSILRQDPDIILVGEIRDVETAHLAVQSALTGHFVLSSIHATDAAAALHRFVDMGIERFLIASSVSVVVSQRLVRRICSACRVPHQASPEEIAFYEGAGGPEKLEFFRGEGCNFCAGTGYQDRIGVYELLRVTEEMRQLVLSSAPHGELKQLAIAQGMRTLLDEGIRLVAEDVTTVAEIMRNIYTL
jgi:type IV pilus assembly protein PilB